MINTIDLFAGCGGLTDGFLQTNDYRTLACVEWDKVAVDQLRHRLTTKYGYNHSKVLHFDMQRENELLNGWNDKLYGSSHGLRSLIKDRTVDVIIGGPPCQAYSVAGRIRDVNGMRDDYRNYLFESYMHLVNELRPKLFVFENVPGILNARPGQGELIINDIRRQINAIGYDILSDLNKALIDFSEYGIPQRRKRIILIGVSKAEYGQNSSELLESFYSSTLLKFKEPLQTVYEAIGDLPKIRPLPKPVRYMGKNYSHEPYFSKEYANHQPRFNNLRDIGIFKLLTEDIESKEYRYVDTDALKELYTSVTGKVSNVHKYNVLRWNEPSNTIPAHLYKDGLRHIHPDSEQARSITVREAARLQTFPDDYEFISNTYLNYKLIGNAVPPKFAFKLAKGIKEHFKL